MRLLLISDTHLPSRAKDLPAVVWDAVDAADVVIHAGDWVDVALLDALEQRSHRLIGVFGNNDHGVLRERLPEVARATLAGVRFVIVHETGAKDRREQRMARAFPDAEVLVFGHSHIPWDTVASSGLRILNPGSCTDRRREPFRTFMTASVHDGELGPVALHRVR
ncbi:MAG: metallophosphoesterase [Nakamurella sp.]